MLGLVSKIELQFSRTYDLPRSIVWDAFVDQDLVEGWLAVARIDARVGGEYRLEWLTWDRPLTTIGVIRSLQPRTFLAVDTDNIGSFEFTLVPVPGGTRGESTDLRLAVVVDQPPVLLPTIRAYWQTSLDQLESLLRGHPVDWDTWREDRGDDWATYLREAGEAN
jgi:uncharacterized protein YndB with AHSA1/START domain